MAIAFSTFLRESRHARRAMPYRRRFQCAKRRGFLHSSSINGMTGVGWVSASPGCALGDGDEFFCQSGTEAVEGALSWREVNGRPRFMVFSAASTDARWLARMNLEQRPSRSFAQPRRASLIAVPMLRPLFAAGQGKAVLDYIRMLFERNGRLRKWRRF